MVDIERNMQTPLRNVCKVQELTFLLWGKNIHKNQKFILWSEMKSLPKTPWNVNFFLLEKLLFCFEDWPLSSEIPNDKTFWKKDANEFEGQNLKDQCFSMSRNILSEDIKKNKSVLRKNSGEKIRQFWLVFTPENQVIVGKQ